MARHRLGHYRRSSDDTLNGFHPVRFGAGRKKIIKLTSCITFNTLIGVVCDS